MTGIFIPLTDHEKMALHELASAELRDARKQAALIIRTELERRGLLETKMNTISQIIPKDAEVPNVRDF
jgi:hypothetical protein